ncbi:hypothetical protein J0X14_10665 [Muricauda sp. CAU 1633]|uniref:hypothetical protein n=1 Tax=Allomuricauda sp. CAU 1633 TaxID=2816036 RepID=UPI001A8E8E1E|nr:hypothetical protein [Muricauda sp. CAU 1633]MBO0322760.1 hypothetical protein [Muricauda sp. CAU 1633]
MWDLSSVSKEYQWVKFNDPEMENKVIRFAKFNCRSLFRIAREEVRHISYSSDSDFLLVHLTDGDKNLYGFYNFKSPKFYPLIGEHSRIFSLISFLSENDIAKLVDDLKVSYESYLESETHKKEVFYLNGINIVVDNFLPTQHWELFQENEAHYTDVIGYLKERYVDVLKDTDDEDIELWRTELGFSNTYQLMEVNFYKKREGRNNRFYLLFDFNWADPFNFRSSFVDGSSGYIHDIWHEQSQAVDKDFSLDSPIKIMEYLRFFCWAVEGDEGHFILPTQDEMPWAKVPDKYSLGIDFYRKLIRTGEVKEKEDSGVTKAIIEDISVVYGTALFTAAFEVDVENGTLEMVDDEPVAADLPFEIPFFKRLIPVGDDEFQKILENIRSGGGNKNLGTEEDVDDKNDDAKPKKGEVVTWDAKENDLKKVFGDKECLNAHDTIKVLETENILEDTCVNERVFINDFLKQPKPVEIRNCVFEGEVRFIGEEHFGRFEFTNCVFKKVVHANGVGIKSTLNFMDCIFKGGMNDESINGEEVSVDFHNFRSESDLIFENCHFFGNATMSNMGIYGDLIFAGCSFSTMKDRLPMIYSLDKVYEPTEQQGRFRLRNQKQIDDAFSKLVLTQSNINGSLKIHGTQLADRRILCSVFAGRIEASGIEVNGEMEVYHCFVNYYADFSSSDFKKSVSFVKHGVQLCLVTKSWQSQVNSVQTKILGQLTFQNSNIKGSLNLSYLETENEINLYGAFVDTYVLVFGLRCNQMNLNFSEIKGGLFAYRMDFSMLICHSLYVKKNIWLSSAKINKIRLEAIMVNGMIIAKTGEFNEVTISMGWGPDTENLKIKPDFSRVKKIDFKSVHIKGDVDLSGVNSKEGVHIGNSSIGGNLLFFNERQFDTMNNLYIDNREVLEVGTFSKMDKQYIKTKKRYDENKNEEYEKEEIDFYIWLQHNKFKSRIGEFSVQRKEGNLELNALNISGRLDLRNLEVDGGIQLDNSIVAQDLDISGILKNQKVQYSLGVLDGLGTSCKEISMRNIQVGRDVLMFGAKTGNDFLASGANIVGGLFLVADDKGRYVEMDLKKKPKYLAIIEGNFDVSVSEIKELSFTDDNFLTSSSSINLERTSVDKFRIIDPTPQGINLTGVKVNQWDFGKGNGNSSAEEYTNVLDKMFPFDKQVYIDIEKSFRNRSEDEDANEIYIKMREKEKNENKSNKSWKWYEKGWDFVYKITTEYGTNFGRLLVLWLGLVLALASFLRGFEALHYASGKTLNFWESLLYAFQCCIPLFELEVVYDIRVNDLWWKYAVFGCTILSYIMLSIALFGFSTRVSRTK